LFLACVYKVKKKLGYRNVTSELEANKGLVRKLGLKKAACKTTLQEAMKRVPEKYADEFLRRLNKEFKKKEKHLVTDATGFGTRRYERFKRKGGEEKRRKCQMHHFIATHYWKLILSQEVTRGPANRDSPMFRKNLKEVKGGETIAGDKAYLSKMSCKLVDKKGMKPYFVPRDSITPENMNGPTVYQEMIREYHESKETWNPIYHTRSIAETLVGRTKQRTRRILFSIKESVQRVEIKLKGIVNNLLALNLVRASDMVGELPLITV